MAQLSPAAIIGRQMRTIWEQDFDVAVLTREPMFRHVVRLTRLPTITLRTYRVEAIDRRMPTTCRYYAVFEPTRCPCHHPR